MHPVSSGRPAAVRSDGDHLVHDDTTGKCRAMVTGASGYGPLSVRGCLSTVKDASRFLSEMAFGHPLAVDPLHPSGQKPRAWREPARTGRGLFPASCDSKEHLQSRGPPADVANGLLTTDVDDPGYSWIRTPSATPVSSPDNCGLIWTAGILLRIS